MNIPACTVRLYIVVHVQCISGNYFNVTIATVARAIHDEDNEFNTGNFTFEGSESVETLWKGHKLT